jgi:gamma-glutamyltranspeptidase / glutathione hydrolase
MKRKHTSILLILLFLPLIALTPTGGRIPIYAKQGMVTSASTIASEIGRDILKRGGNAIDAAVATAFALAVTWPAAGNIGGGGFIVYRPNSGATTTFDFREKAPIAANSKMYLNEKGELIKDLNHVGVLSVGVPGTVAGLHLAHQKYGKLPWSKLVQPSIDLAKKGIPITYALHQQAKNLRKTWEAFPSTMNVMFKDGKDLYEPGERWKQPELAETLKRIKKHGRDGFYKGETAEKFAAFMKKNNGLITEKDLETYEAIERKPVEGSYRNYKVWTMPPPSSGGIALVQMLNILEGYDLKNLGYQSADYVHVVTEAMRRAFADRAEFLGDPDFNPNLPLTKLTSKDYAQSLRHSITMDRASVSDSSKFGQLYEGNSTTHLSVVDKEGNAVALTYTLERSYGSQVVADGLGFFLNDEMGDFNAVPGVTTSDGLVGSEPNQIQPGKRMLSSMTPTILEKDGKLFMVIGSPGGRTIINTVLQVILNVVDHKMNIAQAVEAPRIHHQWLPDKLSFELYGLSPDTQEKLRQKGHFLNQQTSASQGHAMGITVNPETGLLSGVADSRSADGGVAGY